MTHNLPHNLAKTATLTSKRSTVQGVSHIGSDVTATKTTAHTTGMTQAGH